MQHATQWKLSWRIMPLITDCITVGPYVVGLNVRTSTTYVATRCLTTATVDYAMRGAHGPRDQWRQAWDSLGIGAKPPKYRLAPTMKHTGQESGEVCKISKVWSSLHSKSVNCFSFWGKKSPRLPTGASTLYPTVWLSFTDSLGYNPPNEIACRRHCLVLI